LPSKSPPPAGCPTHEIARPASLSPDFHIPGKAAKTANSRPILVQHRENPRPACLLREIAAFHCTKSGHPPVDGPHLLETKQDKTAFFLLTEKLEGVQQDRSLTVS